MIKHIIYVHGEIRKYLSYLELCLAPNFAMVLFDYVQEDDISCESTPILIKILTHEKRDLRGICEHKISGERMS